MLAPYVEQFNRARDRRQSISIQEQVHLLNEKEQSEKIPVKRRLSKAERGIFSTDLLGELVKKAQERAERVTTKEQNRPKPNYVIKSKNMSEDQIILYNDKHNKTNNNTNIGNGGPVSLQEITEENADTSIEKDRQKFEGIEKTYFNIGLQVSITKFCYKYQVFPSLWILQQNTLNCALVCKI